MTDLTPISVNVADPNGYHIYIGEAMPHFGLYANSVWRNPYVIGKDGNRAEVLAKYERHIRKTLDLMDRLPELAGKRLGCWCAKQGQPLTADDPLVCHGQILAKLFREVAREGLQCRS